MSGGRIVSTGKRKTAEALRLLVMLFLILAVRSSLADHYHVPSGSMQYTLQEGDRVFVNKAAYGLRVPFTQWRLTEPGHVARGDVVIVNAPDTGVRLIKRVVAVGGDRVDLANGTLRINGQWQSIPGTPGTEVIGRHMAYLNLENGGGPNIQGLTVPEGKLLLLGDHRGNSRDSRYFGLVDEAAVYGHAVAVYYRRSVGLAWRQL